jgi:hypothetical protein
VLRHDEAELIAYVASHPSAVALILYDANDPQAATAALRRAAAAISRIPHPAEPAEALPNWCEVLDEDGVPVLHLDLQDDWRHAVPIVRIILGELGASGVEGRLEPRQAGPSSAGRAPLRQAARRPPFDYDGCADIFTGMDFLAELNRRGLPPGFPPGFPVPEQGTLVIAQRSPDGDGEHAAWRRSGRPFTDFLDVLRAFGCELGAVPAAEVADYVGPLGMQRYALWRAGEGGCVSLFHEWHRPGLRVSKWYVSVVWQRSAPRPELPVTDLPAAAASLEAAGRPDPAMAGALARSLVPAQHTLTAEMLLAVGEASSVLRPILDALHGGDDRGTMLRLWQRLTPRVDGLTGEQLTLVRHACLTMAGHWTLHGLNRRPRLMAARDDAGRLYVPEVRQRAAAVLGPAQTVGFEAILALLTAARVVDPLIHDLHSGIRPRADLLALTVTGLDDPRLTEVRDACWHIALR